jgi:hypothetical protein
MKIVVGTSDSSVVELQALSGLAPSRSPFGEGTEPVTPQPRKTRCLELEAFSLMALGSKCGAKRARCADPVEHGCGARCLQHDIAGKRLRGCQSAQPIGATAQVGRIYGGGAPDLGKVAVEQTAIGTLS